jgi:predicted acyltransferase
MADSRLVSLDAFRGATIAAMILVNNPGTWSALYWPLGHAAWHGWTPTDLIFPFFLFIVGVAISFSRKTTFRAALRRSAIIFGLGLLLALYPSFDLATLRIPGVLQRIAICYLAAWALSRTKPVVQAVAAAALAVAYWALMTQVPVPDGTPPNLEPETNFGAYVDRAVFGTAHLWRQSRTWDPEGLFSTLPAVTTTLLGLLAGRFIRSERTPERKALGLVAGGAAVALLGLGWGWVFPINKNLWTSSFALFTAGMGSMTLGLCYYVADVRGHRGWTRPFVIYGVNAIAVYVLSGLLADTLGWIQVGDGVSLQEWIYTRVYAPLASPVNASLLYAITNVALLFLIAWWMDRRQLYVKV